MPYHLLIGITLVPNCLAAQVLKKFDLDRHFFEQVLARPITSVDDLKKNPALSDEMTEGKIFTLGMGYEAVALLQRTSVIAFELKHIYIATEHLLAALFEKKDQMLFKALKIKGISSEEFEQHVRNVLKGGTKFKEVSGYFKKDKDQNLSSAGVVGNESKTGILDYFGKELTNNDFQSKLDPIIGRDNEIARVINILGRRQKNNPVLIGDPGVGKTAIVEGLAQKIVKEEVPDILIGKKIFCLDLSSVVAGTIYRGEFEARLKQVLDEIKKDPDIIMFVDEIHNVVGAGSAGGSLDAANILKPPLSRGEITCIGATTMEEYKKYIESDPALERRFQPVMVNEPTKEETIEILTGLRHRYEKYHRVSITDEAIREVVEIADKLMPNKFFPDKAIDLVDEAASKLKVQIGEHGFTKEMRSISKELEKIKKEKDSFVKKEDFAKAHELKTKQTDLEKKLAAFKHLQNEINARPLGEIKGEHIRMVVSDIIKTPLLSFHNASTPTSDDVFELENALKKNIIGQDKAIADIASIIRRFQSGLSDPSRPLASFIFLGPSGVGKTETAKIIAREVFKDEHALVRIDMSEFAEAFNISKLIGSPAGYVGYKEGNKLADEVRKRPHAVVLFDEMEKAHPEVFNLMLQILEDGSLTDAVGKIVNFKNTIIIFTSNIGVESFNKHAEWGFGMQKSEKETLKERFEKVKSAILKELWDSFRIEFLNRIDKVIVFEPLGHDTLKKIVDLRMEDLQKRLEKKKMKVRLSEKAREFLVHASFDPDHGARAVRGKIQDFIEDKIAEALLKRELQEGDIIKVGVRGKDITVAK